MYESNYRPKILYSIGTKRHNRRNYIKLENEIQNITPGSVIGEKFVRPDIINFQLQAHFTANNVNF